MQFAILRLHRINTYIAATKISAGLKLEKAAIASSKKTPWNDNHCHECKKWYTTSRSNSVLQRIPMRKCEFQSRVRISTFRLSAFFKRIPMRKRESTFRHPFGDYNIIKEWVPKSIRSIRYNIVPGPRCQTGALHSVCSSFFRCLLCFFSSFIFFFVFQSSYGDVVGKLL